MSYSFLWGCWAKECFWTGPESPNSAALQNQDKGTYLSRKKQEGMLFRSWRAGCQANLRHKCALASLSAVFPASSLAAISAFLGVTHCRSQEKGKSKHNCTFKFHDFLYFQLISNYEVINTLLYYQRNFRHHWGGLERRAVLSAALIAQFTIVQRYILTWRLM